jgi:hypothetical protein
MPGGWRKSSSLAFQGAAGCVAPETSSFLVVSSWGS